MLMIQKAIRKVVEEQDLTREEAREVMNEMMEGKTTPSQMAGLLLSLRMKGETPDELIGFAQGMRDHVAKVEHAFPDAVDTCGTGGDGGKTFNISTASSIVAAAGGVRIAKHGNRAVSGKSGSADVLEALGVRISMNAKEAEQMLKECGLCFMFAPLYHRAMKHVAPTRSELGVRTCFNLLGPMVNPASVKVQLLGVYDPALTEIVAFVLRELGIERAMVVSGLDCLDELTVTAPTRISELYKGQVRTYEITPEQFGFSRMPLTAIAGGDAQTNASLIREIFQGKQGACRDVVLMNAGAILYVSGRTTTLKEGIENAADLIDSGIAFKKLEEMIHISQEVRHVS